MTLEICIDSYEQAVFAEKYGAQRVELCSALEIGGLTPSSGVVRQCSKLEKIEIHAMVRPRAGDFAYTHNEIEIMMYDIENLAKLQVKGVVFGILTGEDEVHIENNLLLLQQARSFGLEVTFHRAFDIVNDPAKSLEQIIEMGFDRILTSGQKTKAIDGIDLIHTLVSQANRRIQIMAGSGINHTNVVELLKTGIDAVHFSIRKQRSGSTRLEMGTGFDVDEAKIKAVLDIIA